MSQGYMVITNKGDHAVCGECERLTAVKNNQPMRSEAYRSAQMALKEHTLIQQVHISSWLHLPNSGRMNSQWWCWTRQNQLAFQTNGHKPRYTSCECACISCSIVNGAIFELMVVLTGAENESIIYWKGRYYGLFCQEKPHVLLHKQVWVYGQ